MVIGAILLVMLFMGWGFKNARSAQEEGQSTLGVIISLSTFVGAGLLVAILIPVLSFYNETPH